MVIVEAVRTPVGRYKGSLADVRGDHLGALVLQEVIRRADIQPELVDDVVFGCVTQVGEQCANVARTSLLGAGWPTKVPGVTIDRKCGSSEAAIHLAAAEIAAGTIDIAVAGGVESMTRVPMGVNRTIQGEPFGWAVTERYTLTSQGEAAERIADKHGFTRQQLDDFAFESHRRAAAAGDEGRFEREIVPVDIGAWREREATGEAKILDQDETIRRDTTRERLGALKTSFRSEDGRITAGNSSQICDGAAALLLMSEAAAAAHGVRPRARIRAMATVGSDPELMLTGPVAATRRILERTGLSVGDIELFEVNEAFAPVPLLWMRDLGVGHERLNVNGGAIGLGHPLGASGARIMTTLLHEMERRGAGLALQSICCAGGLGTATILELLD